MTSPGHNELRHIYTITAKTTCAGKYNVKRSLRFQPSYTRLQHLFNLPKYFIWWRLNKSTELLFRKGQESQKRTLTWFRQWNAYTPNSLPHVQCTDDHQGNAWWRHQMETFSALLALCAGNSPVSGEVPAQRTVTRSFEIFFDLRLIKRLSKYLRGWWFETLPRPSWRHCNGVDLSLWIIGAVCLDSPRSVIIVFIIQIVVFNVIMLTDLTVQLDFNVLVWPAAMMTKFVVTAIVTVQTATVKRTYSFKHGKKIQRHVCIRMYICYSATDNKWVLAKTFFKMSW